MFIAGTGLRPQLDDRPVLGHAKERSAMSNTEQQAEAAGVTLALTDKAAQEVAKFMTAEQVPLESAGLRVSVLPGGCSGFKYSLNIEERALEDDMVLEVNKVRVFVDGFSAQYLNGVTIDYTTSMQGSGFTFSNPNATGGCGCGSSFTA
jgi:iron-sulfur cluster assembly accessory protein